MSRESYKKELQPNGERNLPGFLWAPCSNFWVFDGLLKYPLEKAMAPHSSTLAWKIPWTEEPGKAAVHGVAKSRTWLSDFTFPFHFYALEKEMATHFSILAWRIPETEELVINV